MSDLTAARNRTYAALDWAIRQTTIKIPHLLTDSFRWDWDADDVSLYAIADSREYRFHVEAEIRRAVWARGQGGQNMTKHRFAVLTVTNDKGVVKWKAEIPEGQQSDE